MTACPLFYPLGAEVLRGNFTDFYTGPVFSGRYNCSENANGLYDCPLIPDQSCIDVGPSRAVGFRCVRGTSMIHCLLCYMLRFLVG
jgi:hypothetical protein